jgi:Ca-activated chloride channel family protein
VSNAIKFEAMFNKNYVPYLNQAQLLYALIEVRPGAAVAHTRLPLNFSLVLDKSGSMSGAKINQLKGAVKWIINQLHPNDHISVITFNTKSKVLMNAMSAMDRGRLHQEVDKLRASGGTTMGPAMRAGLDEIARTYGGDKVSRLILLTDGETSREPDCRKQADAAGQMDVPIVALGLGSDWNEELLIDLAQRSGQLGYADVIQNPEEVAPIFKEVYSRMQIVGQDLIVRLLMVQGMEARRVWQVTPLIKDISIQSVMGPTVAIRLDELEEAGAGYLVEILVPARPPGRYRLGQADVTYTIPSQGAPDQKVRADQKEQADLTVEVTTDPQLAQQVNGRVMNIVERVSAFKLQTQALDEAAAGDIAGATRKLRAAHTRLLAQGETELAQTALEEAERLERGQGLSNEGKKTIKLQSSKTVKLSDLDLP